MNSFYAKFHGPEILLALKPEEIAFRILGFLREHRREEKHFHIQDFNVRSKEEEKFQDCRSVVAEGWFWLENHGLLIPYEETIGESEFRVDSGIRVLSRKGKAVENKSDFLEFRYSQL